MIREIQSTLNRLTYDIKPNDAEENLSSFINRNIEVIKKILDAKFSIIILSETSNKEITIKRIDENKICYLIDGIDKEYIDDINEMNDIKVLDYNTKITRENIIDKINEIIDKVKDMDSILIEYNRDYYIIKDNNTCKIDITANWHFDISKHESRIDYILYNFNEYGCRVLLKKNYLNDKEKKEFIEKEENHFKELFIEDIKLKLKDKQFKNFNEFIHTLSDYELSNFCDELHKSLNKILIWRNGILSEKS